MQKIKPNFLLKSFRFRLVIIIVLACAIAVSLFFILSGKKKNGRDEYPGLFSDTSGTRTNLKLDPEFLRTKVPGDVDSILSNFGIKKEWIVTVTSGEKPVKQKTDKSTKENSAVWFTKYVTVPRDANTAEINLDLSGYTRLVGLTPYVNEDIRTTDIIFDMNDITDTSNGKNPRPLARIIINHSDKVSRESGTFVILLDNIGDYNKNEADDLLENTNEFTFIFPRSPDDIDLQNKLVQMKKEVILNLTEGKNDNYDADFRSGMDLKELKQKVRSLGTDYPAVKTILLTRTDVPPGFDRTFSDIVNELQRYMFRVYTDTSITKLLSKSEEDAKNKVQLIASQLRARAASGKTVMTILSLSYDEFQSFYGEVLTLKKLGYRFYTLTKMIEVEQKKAKIKQEKEEKSKEVKKVQPPKEKKIQPKKKNVKK